MARRMRSPREATPSFSRSDTTCLRTVFTETNYWSAISCTVATVASSGNSTSSRGVSLTAAGAAAAPS